MDAFAQLNEKELNSSLYSNGLKPDVVYALKNIGCQGCSAICDDMKVNGELVTAYSFAKYHEGTLYLTLREPQGIIPALHMLEKFWVSGYEIDSIKIAEVLGESCSHESSKECKNHKDVKDLTKWKIPNRKSYFIMHKRKDIDAEDFLNFYYGILKDAKNSGIKPEFPRDVYFKQASATELEEISKKLEKYNPYHIKDNGNTTGIGILEESIDESDDVKKLIGSLKMYHISEKIRLRQKGETNG